jgi:hypothetical protein
MAMSYLMLALAANAAVVQAQAPPTAAAVQLGSVDSVKERQAVRNLSTCLAKARPRWARKALAFPYLSEQQATEAAEVLNGKDNCLRDAEAEFTFRTSGVIGSLAEHFVRAEITSSDLTRLAKALATVAPLNVSEDFALCIAARDPAASRDLVLSDLGSEAESRAAQRLAAHVSPCTNAGEKLTVDLESLRSLVSTALYRGLITTTSAAR